MVGSTHVIKINQKTVVAVSDPILSTLCSEVVVFVFVVVVVCYCMPALDAHPSSESPAT
jgi:hypothetical protein